MTGDVPSYCPDCGASLDLRSVEGRARPYCPACESVVWVHPATATDVAVADGSRLLLVQRDVPPDAGTWALPGGYLEYDEDPAVGAARELDEEAGVHVDAADLRLVEAVNYLHADGRRVLTLGFLVDRAATAGAPTAGSDAQAATFVSREEARTLDVTDGLPYMADRIDRMFAAVDGAGDGHTADSGPDVPRL